MELLAARSQMALTLGFHIILACFGVGLPVLLLIAEGRYLATRDEGWRILARRWSKAFAVLFIFSRPPSRSVPRRPPTRSCARRLG